MDAISVTWDDWPHVLRTQQFTDTSLEQIIAHARRFEEALSNRRTLPIMSQARNRLLKLIFFEPSTRTEDTFWVAGHYLGCSIRAIPHPKAFSSAAKGESFSHAIAALSRVGGLGELRQADCIVLRHADEGTAQRAAKIVDTANGDGHSKVPLPVINGGDGPGQHPTQAIVDLYTIARERRNNGHVGHPLDDITVLFSGDLRDSRVTNSLLHLLGKFSDSHNIRVVFSTHEDLSPKIDLLEYLARHHVRIDFEPSLPEAIPLADVIYMTRIQRERKGGLMQDYRRHDFVFKKEYLNIMKPGAFVMHPLPINCDPDDPPPEIDDSLTPLAFAGDPRLAYFRQSHLGTVVRDALLDLIFARIDAKWSAV
jgi:aspartate carbamoyltransferase catalytic subunit